jgi:hypothetical protein
MTMRRRRCRANARHGSARWGVTAGDTRALALLLLSVAGCANFRSSPRILPAPLGPLPVERVADVPVRRADPPAVIVPRTPDRLVSLTAADVSVRELLPLLAEAAGVDLVLSPEVEGRVSVRFLDVPAAEALDAVMAQAGLAAPAPPLSVPWIPAVVFYELPVNVNMADALTLQRRFGISAAAAALIVASRND